MTEQWTTNEFKNMIQSGMNWIERHHELCNMINVFPAPDADTGTNIVLTSRSGLRELSDAEPSLVTLTQKLYNGALQGARGNGGVIYSQFFRGLAAYVDSNECAAIDGVTLAGMLEKAANFAYRSVHSPVEGAMLTTLAIGAEQAKQASTNTMDVDSILKSAVAGAHRATTESVKLIRILVDVGYVDAGAVAINLLLEGMLHSVEGITFSPPSVSRPSVLSSQPRWQYERLTHLKSLHNQFLGLVSDEPVTGTIANLVYSLSSHPTPEKKGLVARETTG